MSECHVVVKGVVSELVTMHLEQSRLSIIVDDVIAGHIMELIWDVASVVLEELRIEAIYDMVWLGAVTCALVLSIAIKITHTS